MRSTAVKFSAKKRFYFLLFLLSIVLCVVVARIIFLMVPDRHFLLHEGNARFLRVVNISAYRGLVLDRQGVPLAVSTPVDSVWANPQDFPMTYQNIHRLSQLLHIPSFHIRQELKQHAKFSFLYVKRDINPMLATRIERLSIPGVYLQQVYKRYYPEGFVAAHVVGFTNIDGEGAEGLELAYNKWLRGVPGRQQVLKDRYGHVVAVLSNIRSAQPGHDLTLSIDMRLQYLATQVLKATITKYRAASGSVVVLNPTSGEVLAMVNQPSYNPNNLPRKDTGQFRNRAVTDVFEPGSTMKVFSIASALDSGKYYAHTIIKTSPGWFKVGKNIVRDELNNGPITVTQVLQKSSNVGVAKMTLSLPPEHFVDLLHRVGFGVRTRSGFPGESAGSIVDYVNWNPFDLATLAFGYGISVTTLQLAHAYAVIGDGGLKCPVTFLKVDSPGRMRCPRVMDQKVAEEMLHMLEAVLQPGGTGTRARIKGYHVAGKTGTAYIAGPHGYNKKEYVSSFVGIAPVTNPKLVVAVVIREPQHQHFGAVVAAPAFAKIMSGALRVLNISPDAAWHASGHFGS